MRQILLALGVFAVVVLVFIILQFVKLFLPNTNQTEVRIGEAIFQVEIADTPAARANGLSGRSSLKEDSGMLFIFSAPDIQKFWMKDMKFPIDIIWIRDDKVIGLVIGAEPEPGPDYEIFSSPEPADRVLEINAGLSDKFGFRIGDGIVVK